MKQIPTKTSLLAFDVILKKADIIEGQSIADFGCGNSMFFLYALLTLAGKEGRVYAVDVLPEIITSIKREIAHHNLSGLIPVQADLDASKGVPLPTRSLDAAFLINTLHQSSDTVAMLTEAQRLLKKGGRLVVVDWEIGRSLIGPHPSRRLNKATILEAAEVAGLKKSEEIPVGAHHYGLLFTA